MAGGRVLCASSQLKCLVFCMFVANGVRYGLVGAPCRRDSGSHKTIAPARRSYRPLLFLWAIVSIILLLVFQGRVGNMKNSQVLTGRVVILKILSVVFSLLLLQGCAAMVVGAVVGTVTTLAVEAVKVPFKVGGAVIDVVSDDEDEE